MRSTITDIQLVSLDTNLKCSVHNVGDANCSDWVYAVVTYDEAGATGKQLNVCRKWHDSDPDALAWRRTALLPIVTRGRRRVRRLGTRHRARVQASRTGGATASEGGIAVSGIVYGDINVVGPDHSADHSSLAERRQRFHFDFLNHALKQAEWTFRLSMWFMTGGALIILAGGVLALVHAGNPDLSYMPLVTSLTGALITVGGGALALHSKRTMANLTKAAEDNEKKIDIDHKLEVATTFIDRVEDSVAKDRLNSTAAMKALGMEAAPETMVNRLLPEQTKEIESG
ncbi:hypothetical protein OG601_08150 [Streptomyces sp. NBC_01239]|uniref:TRADD-N-associated membrane domain-containing protein n=1 Tax=Streptomyces sp. NBC_01239 TaxID=2903792 RepID=UPI0022561112|nr:hypothetical protein [Streptomyces sp. NBC_01239]MCX4810592.1 hypothetical protein [Streptomyces sp. NBC_01239]